MVHSVSHWKGFDSYGHGDRRQRESRRLAIWVSADRISLAAVLSKGGAERRAKLCFSTSPVDT